MKSYIFYLGSLFLLLFNACADSFLDQKPSKDLVIPSSLAEFQALLDRTNVMNDNTPGLQSLSADNFVLFDDQYLLGSYVTAERNAYLWEKDVFEGEMSTDWRQAYLAIFYANAVLEGLSKLEVNAATESEWRRVKGSAKFYRAFSYYHLVQLFAPPFDDANTTTKLGVPIRTNANVNELIGRPPLSDNYLHIINDLEDAVEFLPITTPYKTRPSKVAALALLARTYLSMNNYERALFFANEALRLHPYLIDYNTLDVFSPSPFPLVIPNGNDEVIFYASTGAFGFFYNAGTRVDKNLYSTFDFNDLRRAVFFAEQDDGYVRFKGNYSGLPSLFGGLASDELYLTKAESLIRLGYPSDAIEIMDQLLVTRYKQDYYVPISISDPEQLLEFILLERRKQLLGRGIRWTDLRRLNKDRRFQKTIYRTFQGVEYALPPNDKRYVFPIPDDEISSSGIEQNER